MNISTTLLREKFTIKDISLDGQAPLVALSNRLVLPLRSHVDARTETLVIRAQNMHLCIRMGAILLRAYQKDGPIVARTPKYDFEEAWQKAHSEYEKYSNLVRWVAIYHNGKILYSSGEHHHFLDMIEKCDAQNSGNYDDALRIAENMFAQAGRKVAITYDANIAMVLNANNDKARCGLIYRGPDRNSTFNFVSEKSTEEKIVLSTCFHICAAFLEGLQLAFKMGRSYDRFQLGLIEKYSSEMKMAESGAARLYELNTEIKSFLNRFETHFRPELPDFALAIKDAERSHRAWYERTHPAEQKAQ